MFLSDPGAGNGYIFDDYCVFSNRFDVQRHADFIKLDRTFGFKVCRIGHSESAQSLLAIGGRNFCFLQGDPGLRDFRTERFNSACDNRIKG